MHPGFWVVKGPEHWPSYNFGKPVLTLLSCVITELHNLFWGRFSKPPMTFLSSFCIWEINNICQVHLSPSCWDEHSHEEFGPSCPGWQQAKITLFLHLWGRDRAQGSLFSWGIPDACDYHLRVLVSIHPSSLLIPAYITGKMMRETTPYFG